MDQEATIDPPVKGYQPSIPDNDIDEEPSHASSDQDDDMSDGEDSDMTDASGTDSSDEDTEEKWRASQQNIDVIRLSPAIKAHDLSAALDFNPDNTYSTADIHDSLRSLPKFETMSKILSLMVQEYLAHGPLRLEENECNTEWVGCTGVSPETLLSMSYDECRAAAKTCKEEPFWNHCAKKRRMEGVAESLLWGFVQQVHVPQSTSLDKRCEVVAREFLDRRDKDQVIQLQGSDDKYATLWRLLAHMRELKMVDLIVYRSQEATELLKDGTVLPKDLEQWAPFTMQISAKFARYSKDWFAFESQNLFTTDSMYNDRLDQMEIDISHDFLWAGLRTSRTRPPFALHDIERRTCLGSICGMVRHGAIDCEADAIAGPDSLWLDLKRILCSMSYIQESEDPQECNVNLCWEILKTRKSPKSLEIDSRVMVVSSRPIKFGQVLVRYKHQ